MNKEKYFKLIGLDIIYFILVIIFLYKLNILNHTLLLKELRNENVFELLGYNNYLALRYFCYAIILLFVAIILIYFKYKVYTEEYHTINEVYIMIIVVIGLFICIWLIILFINNPILRIILTASSISIAGIIGLTNK